MDVKIDSKLLDRIVNYLVTKPYNEVALLLNDIQKDLNKQNLVIGEQQDAQTNPKAKD